MDFFEADHWQKILYFCWNLWAAILVKVLPDEWVCLIWFLDDFCHHKAYGRGQAHKWWYQERKNQTKKCKASYKVFKEPCNLAFRLIRTSMEDCLMIEPLQYQSQLTSHTHFLKTRYFLALYPYEWCLFHERIPIRPKCKQ